MNDDLIKRLTTKAQMIALGERIAWGSETDLMHDAAARIAELEAEVARCWQPIETAPQDGTLFLGLCGKTVSTWRIVDRPEKRKTVTKGIWPFRTVVETVEQEAGLYLEGVTDGGGIFYISAGRMLGLNPTHWMPLPEPPNAS